jgi:IS30 family transposase
MRRKASDSWRDVDRRMRRAVQLRQQGLSLRKIADQMAVHHSTIAADLARWEAENVDRLLSDIGVGYGSEKTSRIRQPDPTDRRMQ